MASNPKKEKIASKVKTGFFNRKKFLAPNSIQGKIKNKKHCDPDFGIPNGTYQFSQQPFHINLEILTKDGQRVEGDLVIKYKIMDVKKYFESLYEWKNSIEDFQNELGYEINAELSDYGLKHTSAEILTNTFDLWADIQNKNGVTFREMGIRPYKTFVKWYTKSPVVDFTIEQIIEDKVKEENGKLIEERDYLKDRIDGIEKNYNSLIETIENEFKNTTSDLKKIIEGYKPVVSGKEKDLEKINYQTQELKTGLNNLTSEFIDLTKRLNEVNELKKEVILLSKKKASNKDISDYLHDKSIAYTMSDPTRYNASCKGPEFIDEFIKEGTSLYEKLTDPHIIFGEDVLKAIAERAHKKVYEGKK